MTPKKRLLAKPKIPIREHCAQSLAIRSAELARLYAELLRLRRAVRQAELLARRTKGGFDLH
jgi:hypothetical protein